MAEIFRLALSSAMGCSRIAGYDGKMLLGRADRIRCVMYQIFRWDCQGIVDFELVTG